MYDINYIWVSSDTNTKPVTHIFWYNFSVVKEVVYMQIFYALDKSIFLFKWNIKCCHKPKTIFYNCFHQHSFSIIFKASNFAFKYKESVIFW